MPFLKRSPTRETRSQRLETAAALSGLRHAVFGLNGTKYIGEWKNNKKSGKGQFFTKSGKLYEGDFENNLPHGFGVIGSPSSENKKNVYHLSCRGKFIDGKMDSDGCFHQTSGTYYTGQWKNGKREGYGLFWYSNGEFYAGNFLRGKRHGSGMFVYMNGNRYEGEWKDGMKHGRGRFFHLNKGQMQEGVWVKDICVCSTITVIPFRQRALDPTQYPIHAIELEDVRSMQERREKKVVVGEAESCKSLHFDPGGPRVVEH